MMQPKPYEVEELSTIEVMQEHPELWLTIAEYIPHLSEDEMTVIAMIVLDTCPHCHAANRKCQCWNDD